MASLTTPPAPPPYPVVVQCSIYTVLILMERMIQFIVRNLLFTDSHNVYIGAIDDLYQKMTRFSKPKLFFLHTLY